MNKIVSVLTICENFSEAKCNPIYFCLPQKYILRYLYYVTSLNIAINVPNFFDESIKKYVIALNSVIRKVSYFCEMISLCIEFSVSSLIYNIFVDDI